MRISVTNRNRKGTVGPVAARQRLFVFYTRGPKKKGSCLTATKKSEGSAWVRTKRIKSACFECSSGAYFLLGGGKL